MRIPQRSPASSKVTTKRPRSNSFQLQSSPGPARKRPHASKGKQPLKLVEWDLEIGNADVGSAQEENSLCDEGFDPQDIEHAKALSLRREIIHKPGQSSSMYDSFTPHESQKLSPRRSIH